MNACPSFRRLRHGIVAAFSCLVLLLGGCGGTPDGESHDHETEDIDLIAPIPTDTSARADSLVQHLALRYLSYSYRGASLRSTHPLNDSLFALKAGRATGGAVMLVDSFSVEAHTISHQDSTHTIRIRVPAALAVSNVWEASNPRTEYTFTLRIEGNKVAKAPRLVGWPALKAHIMKVEADSGAAIVKRLQQRWSDLTDAPPSV